MADFLNVAIKAAEKAGEVLLAGLDTSFDIEFKGEIDLVTKYDKLSQEIIINFIRERFPTHAIVAEEDDQKTGQSEVTWYIDPLDGTTNYAHRLPWFAVSIAAFSGTKPLCGVVYNPANRELFCALEGLGAWCNGKKISVSSEDDPVKSLFATGFPYYIHKKPERVMKNLGNFVVKVQGLRRFGAASLDLAYIAAGRYDGYWEEGLMPWDTAAGMILVKEAGGKITDYEGKEFDINKGTIAASNGRLHDFIVKTLNE